MLETTAPASVDPNESCITMSKLCKYNNVSSFIGADTVCNPGNMTPFLI